MQVVYLSGFAHSWSTETHIARDMESLGHTVDRVIEPAAASNRFLFDLYDRARTADLFLYTKAKGLPGEAVSLWRQLEAASVPSVSWHLDLYMGLPRAAEIGRDPMWHTTYVYTADGDPRTQAFMAQQSIRHRWMPPAVVSDECVPGTVWEGWPFEVVFVGSPAVRYHPSWPWRQILLDGLDRRYGPRFGCYGTDRRVHGLELNDLYASTAVVVGDSLCLQGHQNYFSDRYFETVGRGGFLVGPAVPGIEQFLTPRAHWQPYTIGDLDGVIGAVDNWLRCPEARAQVKAQGQQHVREHHTYRHRIEKLFREVGR